MKTKSTSQPSFFQVLLDKYIYYVVINKNHRQLAKSHYNREVTNPVGNLYHA